MKFSIINSTLALTMALLLTIILHELAHYIVALGLGYKPTLFHNRVEYGTSGPELNHMWIAAAGPLFSLVQGIIAYFAAKRMRTSSLSLFCLWFAVAGLITFFGYLMIAPLVPIGDTGKVFRILNIPMLIQIACAILAIVLITLILIRSTVLFERHAIEDFGSTEVNRKRWAVSLILYPLLISILLSTVCQFPIPHIISILATICAPFSIMAVFGTFIGRKTAIKSDENGESINKSVSKVLLLLLVIVAIVNRLLVSGV